MNSIGLGLTILLVSYVAVVLALSAYGLHAGALLFLYLRRRHDKDHEDTSQGQVTRSPSSLTLPKVTIQIPVYNERCVVERIIYAAAALDYPKGLLQIQILDDSTDETRGIARQSAEALRARGIDIQVIHRDDRTGYKAGALANGLATATGELIAVFDADFVPPPHFLRRLIVERMFFDDCDVGFVQTRWGYLNRDEGILTRAQALLLDKHFFVEQPARCQNGLLFNFNGSGGIWRKSCIVDAGGWQHDTLTEDLDLSYRAELRGWRGLYIDSEVTPSELPADLSAFKKQQRRWARGSAQCLRKLGGSVLRADLSPWQKLAAFLHMGGYAFQLLLLLFIVLWPQILFQGMFRGDSEITVPVWIHLLSPICLAVMTSMLVAYKRQGGRFASFVRELPTAIMLTVGVSFSNAVAVLLGLFYRPSGEFERTPKKMTPVGQAVPGEKPSVAYRIEPHWTRWAELGLAGYAFTMFGLLLGKGYSFAALPMVFYGMAYGLTGLSQFKLFRSPFWTHTAIPSFSRAARGSADSRVS